MEGKMTSFTSILKGLALLFSFLGYFYLAKKRLAVTIEIIPIVTFSSIALLVYLGGLLDILPTTTYLLLIIGIGFFIHALIDIRKRLKARDQTLRLSLFDLLFLISTLVFIFSLSGVAFQHYDNFSHWGIVIKDMLLTDAFPNAQSLMIDNKDYPLGVSSFVYYVCRIVSRNQGTMLVAQALLIFSSFYALFMIIKEKQLFLFYSLLCAGLSILSLFNTIIGINNLLVDFILPLLALVALAIIARYQDQPAKAALLLIPVLGLLVITKSTGIIFATIPLIYFIYLFFKKKENCKRKSIITLRLTLVFSLLPVLLWKLHMILAFGGLESKFTLTAARLQSGFASKTPEQIGQIIRLFSQSITDITSRPVIAFIVFNLLIIALYLFIHRRLNQNTHLLKVLVALDTVVVFYLLGILGLYLFSMPVDEALRLASFNRYASSIIVFFIGGLLLFSSLDLEKSFSLNIKDQAWSRSVIKSQKKYQLALVISLTMVLIFLVFQYQSLVTSQQYYPTSLPGQISSVLGDHWPEDGQVDQSPYLVYASDDNDQVTNSYASYVAKYFLYAHRVDGISSFDEDHLTEQLKNYDYLVIIEADPEERALLKKHFNLIGSPGLYKISELLARQSFER